MFWAVVGILWVNILIIRCGVDLMGDRPTASFTKDCQGKREIDMVSTDLLNNKWPILLAIIV